jgi:hypothetical protein
MCHSSKRKKDSLNFNFLLEREQWRSVPLKFNFSIFFYFLFLNERPRFHLIPQVMERICSPLRGKKRKKVCA